MANMFNRQLIGDYNYFLIIAGITFFLVYLASLSMAIWALLFKVPIKYKKIPFMKMINKEFLNSIDEVDRKKLLIVRRYLLIAIFLTVFRFLIGVLVFQINTSKT